MADSGREQYGPPGVPPGAEGREGAADGVAGSPGAAIVKVYAERAGLDPADFGGHSLRSGFLTSAAEAGASVFKMLEVSRHKSMATLRGYAPTFFGSMQGPRSCSRSIPSGCHPPADPAHGNASDPRDAAPVVE